MKFKNILLNNIWLKIMALVLALITLFYVSEANKTGTEKTVLQRLLSSSYYLSKQLQIRPYFTGEVPEGYEFRKNEAKVNPESVVVIGPARVLAKKDFLNTKPIDLNEHTKEKTLDAELEDIAGSSKSQKIKVQVYLPIVKLENTGKKE